MAGPTRSPGGQCIHAQPVARRQLSLTGSWGESELIGRRAQAAQKRRVALAHWLRPLGNLTKR